MHEGGELVFFGVHLYHVVAGAAGGAVRALVRPEHHWGRNIGTAIAGALTAGYLTPIVTPLVHAYIEVAPAANLEGATGFGIGLFTIAGVEGAWRLIKQRLDRHAKG